MEIIGHLSMIKRWLALVGNMSLALVFLLEVLPFFSGSVNALV
jgi:hypothetical protein